jgi:hypothetical protein
MADCQVSGSFPETIAYSVQNNSFSVGSHPGGGVCGYKDCTVIKAVKFQIEDGKESESVGRHEIA